MDLKVAELRAAVIEADPKAKDDDFITDATCVRYLRARSHDIQAATAMLQRTLAFRRSRGASLGAVCQHCVKDPHSHSFIPIGPTSTGPVVYSNFSVSCRDPEAAVQHMLFAMEALFSAHDTQRMVWVMDFHGFRTADVSPANARSVLTLFADHYPERLGRAVIYGAPLIFYGLWRAVKLFAAPETVRKVTFVKHSVTEARKSALQDTGIRDATLDRLISEIDDARSPTAAAVNRWSKRPLEPLPHYGARILRAQAGE